jgi:hypothetical protein
VRIVSAASELAEGTFRWLQEHYDQFSFYQERDLVWTVQSHLAAEIRRGDLDLRVWNDYPMFREGRRAESADLVLQTADGTIKVAIELKYEPSHIRPDIQRRKLPVVFWGSEGVAHDIERARRFVAEGKAEVAYAVFVDEGSHFRHREAHAGSRWIDWKARTPDGHQVAMLWSRWPADEP